MNKGILNGIAAYALWGFFPIYWKLLHNVPAPQLLSHRIGWSFLLLLAVILVTRQWNDFRSTLNARTFRIYSDLSDRRASHRRQLADVCVGGQRGFYCGNESRLFY